MNLPSDLTAVVDVVIGITVFEFIALGLYRRATGKGVALRDIASNMVSGLFLMLALRCRVSGADAVWVGVFLLAAGLAHATDIVGRWRHEPRATRVDERSVA